MIVIDTSVAIKWVVVEEGHEQALSIIDMGQDLAASAHTAQPARQGQTNRRNELKAG